MLLRRRSTILINRSFQLRFSLYVCSWIFALSVIYPLLIHRIFDMFVRYAALDPMGPPLERLMGAREEITMVLVGSQILFVCATFLISIFVSHRIAGPLYKLRKGLEEAPSKNFKNISFRSRDYFQELSASFNHLMGKLRTQSTAMNQAIERLEAGDSAKALELLKNVSR